MSLNQVANSFCNFDYPINFILSFAESELINCGLLDLNATISVDLVESAIKELGVKYWFDLASLDQLFSIKNRNWFQKKVILFNIENFIEKLLNKKYDTIPTVLCNELWNSLKNRIQIFCDIYSSVFEQLPKFMGDSFASRSLRNWFSLWFNIINQLGNLARTSNVIKTILRDCRSSSSNDSLVDFLLKTISIHFSVIIQGEKWLDYISFTKRNSYIQRNRTSITFLVELGLVSFNNFIIYKEFSVVVQGFANYDKYYYYSNRPNIFRTARARTSNVLGEEYHITYCTSDEEVAAVDNMLNEFCKSIDNAYSSFPSLNERVQTGDILLTDDEMNLLTIQANIAATTKNFLELEQILLVLKKEVSSFVDLIQKQQSPCSQALIDKLNFLKNLNGMLLNFFKLPLHTSVSKTSFSHLSDAVYNELRKNYENFTIVESEMQNVENVSVSSEYSQNVDTFDDFRLALEEMNGGSLDETNYQVQESLEERELQVPLVATNEASTSVLENAAVLFENVDVEQQLALGVETSKQRGPGRPRKRVYDESAANVSSGRRQRGRPRTVNLEPSNTGSLPPTSVPQQTFQTAAIQSGFLHERERYVAPRRSRGRPRGSSTQQRGRPAAFTNEPAFDKWNDFIKNLMQLVSLDFKNQQLTEISNFLIKFENLSASFMLNFGYGGRDWENADDETKKRRQEASQKIVDLYTSDKVDWSSIFNLLKSNPGNKTLHKTTTATIVSNQDLPSCLKSMWSTVETVADGDCLMSAIGLATLGSTYETNPSMSIILLRAAVTAFIFNLDESDNVNNLFHPDGIPKSYYLNTACYKGMWCDEGHLKVCCLIFERACNIYWFEKVDLHKNIEALQQSTNGISFSLPHTKPSLPINVFYNGVNHYKWIALSNTYSHTLFKRPYKILNSYELKPYIVLD